MDKADRKRTSALTREAGRVSSAPHYVCGWYKTGERAFTNELPPTTDLYDTGYEEAGEQWHDDWMGLSRPE